MVIPKKGVGGHMQWGCDVNSLTKGSLLAVKRGDLLSRVPKNDRRQMSHTKEEN